MANTKPIPRERWTEYFDAFSKKFLRDETPEAATVRLLSDALGDQDAVRDKQVIGITYDHKDNLLDVALEGIDHVVYHPREIRVAEEPNGFIREIDLVRDDGEREVVRLQTSRRR
ncbi:MAG TPA: DUF5335 family protein [Longimicrobiales bacterium]|nr:DUF5335 family protein [Longimicrobiales bacterium]